MSYVISVVFKLTRGYLSRLFVLTFFVSILDSYLIGCFDKTCFNRHYIFFNDNMTTTLCTSRCRNLYSTFAGLKGGDSCFCTNHSCEQGDVRCNSECGIPCTGDQSIMCGGLHAVQIFQLYKGEDIFILTCVYLDIEFQKHNHNNLFNNIL